MTTTLQKHGENGSVARFAWLRRGLVALFAVVILSGFSSVARASCGDWLADPNNKMAGQHGMLPGQVGSLPGPAPCKGPLCQKAPAAPSPAVPATAFEHVDKLGLAFDAMAIDALAGQTSLTPNSDVHPSKGFLPRIEHPPRV